MVSETGAIRKLRCSFPFAFYSNYGRSLSVAVCEIFSVKKWCDLENRVRVRSRSFEMAPMIDRIRVLFVFHSNYGAVLYRLQDIATYWSKIAKFLYPTCTLRPRKR